VRFLADENIASLAISALRSSGVDVLAVADVSPGAPDVDVLGLANREGRVLVTFDKDFAELAYRRELAVSAGAVLLRVRSRSPREMATVLVDLLTSDLQWNGHFSVVADERVRMIPLSPAKDC
jgi:predicted nuclease of predicted toxin-antitoxin system